MGACATCRANNVGVASVADKVAITTRWHFFMAGLVTDSCFMPSSTRWAPQILYIRARRPWVSAARTSKYWLSDGAGHSQSAAVRRPRSAAPLLLLLTGRVVELGRLRIAAMQEVLRESLPPLGRRSTRPDSHQYSTFNQVGNRGVNRVVSNP